MDLIIGKGKPDGLSLPMLPYYQEWAYDTGAKKLVVVEFPAKKEQRKQETTGARTLTPRTCCRARAPGRTKPALDPGPGAGVGFRPFVWRRARRFGLVGWVENFRGGLIAEVQGPARSVAGFLQDFNAAALRSP